MSKLLAVIVLATLIVPRTGSSVAAQELGAPARLEERGVPDCRDVPSVGRLRSLTACRSDRAIPGAPDNTLRTVLRSVGERVLWNRQLLGPDPEGSAERVVRQQTGTCLGPGIADGLVLAPRVADLLSTEGFARGLVVGETAVRLEPTRGEEQHEGGFASVRIVPSSDQALTPTELLTAIEEVREQLLEAARGGIGDSIDPAWIEPNWVFSLSRLESPRPDHHASSTHAYELIGLPSPGGGPQVEIPRLHPVALIDSGVNRIEGELTEVQSFERTLGGWSGLPSPPLSKLDATGHGTALGALIAAADDALAPAPPLGIRGLSPGTSLLSYRTSMGEEVLVAGDVASSAIRHAVDQGAKIILLAMNHDCAARNVYEALASAIGSGVLVVSSAGNHARSLSQRPSYPASFAAPPAERAGWTVQPGDWFADPDVPELPLLNVAASHAEPCAHSPGVPCYTDLLADSSNFSIAEGSVHLAAPGVDIRTLQYDELHGSSLLQVSGTSIAAAMVAGAAAHVWDRSSPCDAAQIRRALIDTGDSLADADPAPTHRAGPARRLNVANALAALQEACP
ncbi:MAG TPA: S8 family serine peptidase [Thermoanaerobaculia bacterium]|nr:S8 family serine peptidase [Thermoanaerobaculia bacterium]